MKKIILFIVVIVFAIGLFAIAVKEEKTNDEILRLHIRANSNDKIDQDIKLKVRDEVVEFIKSQTSNAKDKKEVEKIVRNNKKEILKISDRVLHENGFSYDSNMKIVNEYFPTRSYGDISFESGYYDSVIIELGTGTGNNWWCAIYPPLCFIGEENLNKDFEYKSKIIEMIKKRCKK